MSLLASLRREIELLNLDMDKFYNLSDKQPTPANDEKEASTSISDVLEVLNLDEPSFGAMAQPQEGPYVQIIEQPASKALRFRYPCESRSTGAIPGVSSNADYKTYPTIKIHNYTGPVGIVVSCVTKDPPHRPHPHHLVGRGQCFNHKKGVFAIRTTITEESNVYQFMSLGIQCLKKREMAESLCMREKLRIDPFNTGFDHIKSLHKIDMYAVRLCFQVLIPDATGRLRQLLTPVVSNVIYDKKVMADPVIVKTSHCSGTARGGTQAILLCDKVNKDDTVVVFYLQENNKVVWEAMATIIDVHKQVAMLIETPAFRDPNTREHVTVLFQLRNLSNSDRSNSIPFEYIPDPPDFTYKRKIVLSLLRSHGDDIVMKRVQSKARSSRSPVYHQL